MPLDYEREFQRAYQRNVQDAPRAAECGELDEKIDNYVKHTDSIENTLLSRPSLINMSAISPD